MLSGGRPLDDAHAVAQRIGRMEDDRLPGVEAARHLRFGGVALAQLDELRARATFFDHEDRPLVAAPEEAADGHLEDVGLLPHDDPNLDAVGVARALSPRSQDRRNR